MLSARWPNTPLVVYFLTSFYVKDIAHELPGFTHIKLKLFCFIPIELLKRPGVRENEWP